MSVPLNVWAQANADHRDHCTADGEGNCIICGSPCPDGDDRYDDEGNP